MRFLSLFSGIEAASMAWTPLGWEPAAFSEIEPFPCSVLQHHYPHVPNLGDVTKITRQQVEALGRIDLVCGGFPCQDLSVAGKRNGLMNADGNPTRSGLFFDAMRIAEWTRARWTVLENVPGLFSSNGGRDFAAVVGEMAGCEFDVPPGGWENAGVAVGPFGLIEWITLDAQYVRVESHPRAVPQRRRRVFLVRDSGNWANRPPLFLERESLRGHPSPRRQTGQGVAGTISARTQGGGGLGTDFELGGGLVTHALRGEGFDASEDGTGRGTPLEPMFLHTNKGRPDGRRSAHTEMVSVKDIVETLTTDGHAQSAVAVPVAYGIRTANTSSNGWGIQEEHTHTLDCAQGVAVAVALRGREGGATAELGDEVQNCLRASSGGGDKPHVLTAMQVRRLTPTECERLQGFPAVLEKITIEACLDHQNQSVRVALKCLRWQNSVSHADENELTQPAKTADARSSTSPAHLAPLAALHVRMHSVDELLEIRSAGRLIWSASGAGQSRKSLPPTLTENSVQELARLLREVARTITAGKAESPPSIRLSFPASSGAINAEKSGREMEESASDAMSDQHRATFTTSDLGLITTFSDSTAETLSCFALHAIAGCIPSTTLPETFSIEMTVETPYTAIPWRGKPADQCPDGPRYKSLGNSWAINCARWIGERIEAVEAVETIVAEQSELETA